MNTTWYAVTNVAEIDSPGHERDQQRKAGCGHLQRGLKPVERIDLAPDAERRGAARLVSDGAVIELA